ncbi:STAS domain-containing protein [Streptomyces sp. NPDC101178]|uniref:STAS domain-containing protein n=1 Tax=Streptomyces sp. NPDC101178 TaxID=3366124 RepID=UPI0037F8BB6B
MPPTPPPARVHSYEENGTFVVAASGEFDLDEQEQLLAALGEADRRNLPATAVDLSGVTFADSSLLNALLHAWRRHRTSGRRLILAGPLHPTVTQLLTVTGTLEHFEIAETLSEALA